MKLHIRIDASPDLELDAGKALIDIAAHLFDHRVERIAFIEAVRPRRLGLNPIAQRPAHSIGRCRRRSMR
jgi:hypothetical protein